MLVLVLVWEGDQSVGEYHQSFDPFAFEYFCVGVHVFDPDEHVPHVA